MKNRCTTRAHSAIALIAMTAVAVAVCGMAAASGTTAQHACCKGQCPTMSAAIPNFAIAPILHLVIVQGIVPPTMTVSDVRPLAERARLGTAILTFPLRI